jgi:hypothetical protein
MRRRHVSACAVFLALLVALLPCVSATAGTDQLPGRNCVGEDSTSAREAGDPSGDDDDDAPPELSAVFYTRTFTLDASLDGMQGNELPIAIEEVCDVAKKHAKEAAQLAGADGTALLLPTTTVWLDRQRVTGTEVATALDGADTAILKVRLTPQRSWHKDEEGNRVATFSARRIEITD